MTGAQLERGWKTASIYGFREIGVLWGKRLLYRVGKPAPLIGHIAFGVIDRGTNVLQVRPTTICPQSCIFCSVDAGPASRRRASEFIVEPDHLVEWVAKIAQAKNVVVEALIDGVGEPLTYPWIVELVRMLKETGWVKTVAVETHGAPLSKQLIDRLAEAGLDRVNFSIETLDPDKARKLYGAPWYDLKRVISLIEYLVKETPIDLHVTPVWLPGINDEDIPKIIEWALKIGAGKRWPPVTVQKYVVHKRGRKVEGVREVSWDEFWRWLENLEQKLGVRLRYRWEEWGIRSAPQVKPPVKVGDVVRAQVVARGWLRGEVVGVLLEYNWLVTIAPAKYLELGDIVKIKITRDKDGILLGCPV